MTVALSSKNSLKDMRQWVKEKLSPIKNYNVEVPDLMKPAPFDSKNQGKLVRMVPIKDEDEISFVWTLPYSQKELKKQPVKYLSHLFGHEGENSLMSWLKNKGLAHTLTSLEDHNLWGMTTFELNIQLTKKGLKNYKEVIESVS